MSFVVGLVNRYAAFELVVDSFKVHANSMMRADVFPPARRAALSQSANITPRANVGGAAIESFPKL